MNAPREEIDKKHRLLARVVERVMSMLSHRLNVL